MRALSLLLFVLAGLHSALAQKQAVPQQTATQSREMSLVRVNVTGQAYDYLRPWQKRAPFSKRALGAVLSQGRVLVTADLVGNQNYVELERAETGEKMAASVAVVDYEANLALLQPQDEKFLQGLTPLELATDAAVGDRLSILQLEPTGALVVTDGLLTGVQVTRYPADVGQFLTYRVSVALQYRDNSYTVPVLKGNKLAGLLLRYDPRSQVMDVIPANLIAHFLQDASSGNYGGFPSLGFSYFPTRDPQLRKYAGETDDKGGIYVTGVEPGSAVEKAGLKAGDIITGVGNFELDQNGNYLDPQYKKVEFSNLLSTRGFVGGKTSLHVIRQGQPLSLEVTLAHRAPQDYVVPPYLHDVAPDYVIVGGVIFQELSRELLREWGPNWAKDAPQRLVYLDRFQWELFPEGNQHIVIVNQVIPVNGTIGYDDLGFLVVKRVNGQDIRSLADLAEAVKQSQDGFIKIETEDEHKTIILDAAQLAKDDAVLRDSYGIPELQRLKSSPR